MAIDSTTTWEVQTGGSDDNGGGFVPGASGTDYSQQTASQATLSTASVVNSTTTIIDVDSGDYTCTDNDVGNILQITGGTATAGYYEITARSAQQWTLDRAAGTAGQTVVGKMGGALATPGEAAGAVVAGNKVWIKSGTYTLSTNVANTSGGQCNPTTTGTEFMGYETTRGDTGARPVLNAGTQVNVSLWYPNVSSHTDPCKIANVDADGNSQTGVTGFLGHTNGRNPWFNTCRATACVIGFNQASVENCRADNCTTGFSGCLDSNQCVAHDNSIGMTCALDSEHTHFLAHDNTNQGADVANRHVKFIQSTFVDNGNDGIEFRSDVGAAYDCIFYGNGGYGIGGTDVHTQVLNCAFGSNTSGNTETTFNFIKDSITLTADPFTDNANDDYSLNNTAGGGALLRAGATNWVGDYQTQYNDVGAMGHEDPAGGGGLLIHPGMAGGIHA